jgi:hypothetical protein
MCRPCVPLMTKVGQRKRKAGPMRDDFTEEVKRDLGLRVGLRCSNPSCQQPTSGPSESSKGVTNVGVATHITAASQGGPRYDASLNAEERASLENGVWLCQKCGKAVDDDPVIYTCEMLRDWKSQAEVCARQAIEGGPKSCGPVMRQAPILRLLAHRAFFNGNPIEHIFVKIVNMTPDADVEVTHVWYQNGHRVDILSRPLPVRLRPSETWETYIPASSIPRDAHIFQNFHALISTGEVFAAVHNKDVPPSGYLAGR